MGEQSAGSISRRLFWELQACKKALGSKLHFVKTDLRDTMSGFLASFSRFMHAQIALSVSLI